MHLQNFVIAIKANGRVLREQADLVTLPFGTEFSVYVKNLNSVRAQFTVSVDGKDATEGCRLILSPNSSVELERFIKGGNLSTGNKFRYIERTAAVEAHRGVGAEDGLVRVECWKERFIPPPVYTSVHHYYDVWHPNRPPYYPHPYKLGGNISYGYGCHTSVANNTSNFRSFDSGGTGAGVETEHGGQHTNSVGNLQRSVRSSGIGGSSLRSFMPMEQSAASASASVNDAGITVPGSLSTQSFTSMSSFPLEAASVVLVLKLRGEVAGRLVAAPVTVATKVKCRVCGLIGKSSAQFCSRCGAALIQY